MPLAHNDNDGILTIGTVSMNPANGAWGVLGDKDGQGGLVQLWVEYDIRGQDRILPGVPGVIAYQRRMTVTRHDLRFLVVGDIDGQTSLPVMDQRIGLQDNLSYLHEEVFAPVDSSTGMRYASLEMPGGELREAFIHVLGVKTQTYHLNECGSIWIGTLQIDIPGGRFEGTESS